MQRGALAQPIQLGLLVAEEKLFRRHTSSFKGDIKDTKDKKNNKDNIFKLFRRRTLALWRISTFYLFSKTFKYCLLANLSLRRKVLGNLFQQLLDAKHLEDQFIGTELFEDVSLTEGGDHRAVQALP